MCHLRVLSLLILASVCSSAPRSPADSDTAILNVVNTSNPSFTSNREPIWGMRNPVHLDKPTDCECVPHYQCQNASKINVRCALIDIKSGFGNDKSSSSLRSTCESDLHICCQIPNILSPDVKLTPRPMPLNECGRRNADGIGFIVTGDMDDEAQFGEFPWMVAILAEEKRPEVIPGDFSHVYQCGGALIHAQAVLTAAHCVFRKEPSQLLVRAGEYNTQNMAEFYPHQNLKVSKIIIHEDFNSNSLSYDYAILILSEPANLTASVDLVCLPEQGEQFDGSRCFATGWGKNKSGFYQVILKRMELPIVPSVTCENSLRSTFLGNHFALHPSFICAGGEPEKDMCKGDDGGPLVCPSKNDPTRYVQAGIVAWGIGCGENGVPEVYANIAAVRRWIDEKMAYNDLNVYSAISIIGTNWNRDLFG